MSLAGQQRTYGSPVQFSHKQPFTNLHATDQPLDWRLGAEQGLRFAEAHFSASR
jgi:hypothetical protein